jgi:hypothetical protein
MYKGNPKKKKAESLMRFPGFFPLVTVLDRIFKIL